MNIILEVKNVFEVGYYFCVSSQPLNISQEASLAFFYYHLALYDSKR